MDDRKLEPGTRCPECRGTGVDPSLPRRYTTGGHNDRTCKRCGGECYVQDEAKKSADSRNR